MAKPYPILPISVLDELHDLNAALDAYHQLITAWIHQTMNEGPSGDRELFAAGCQLLLRPIMEGFQNIESEISAFRDIGFVGVGHISEAESDSE